MPLGRAAERCAAGPAAIRNWSPWARAASYESPGDGGRRRYQSLPRASLPVFRRETIRINHPVSWRRGRPGKANRRAARAYGRTNFISVAPRAITRDCAKGRNQKPGAGRATGSPRPAAAARLPARASALPRASRGGRDAVDPRECQRLRGERVARYPRNLGGGSITPWSSGQFGGGLAFRDVRTTKRDQGRHRRTRDRGGRSRRTSAKTRVEVRRSGSAVLGAGGQELLFGNGAVCRARTLSEDEKVSFCAGPAFGRPPKGREVLVRFLDAQRSHQTPLADCADGGFSGHAFSIAKTKRHFGKFARRGRSAQGDGSRSRHRAEWCCRRAEADFGGGGHFRFFLLLTDIQNAGVDGICAWALAAATRSPHDLKIVLLGMTGYADQRRKRGVGDSTRFVREVVQKTLLDFGKWRDVVTRRSRGTETLLLLVECNRASQHLREHLILSKPGSHPQDQVPRGKLFGILALEKVLQTVVRDSSVRASRFRGPGPRPAAQSRGTRPVTALHVGFPGTSR